MEFIYEINEEKQKVNIIGIKDCPKKLVIPATIQHTDNKEYAVDFIYLDSDDLTCESISFSSTDVSIRLDCNDTIKEVILPDKLEKINNLAFIGCEKLERVVFPDTLKFIGEAAFQYCKSINELIIPDSVKSIGDFAFADCISLTNVKLPENLNELGVGAFQGCSSLQKIVIPKSLELLDAVTFKDCIKLSDVKTPTNLTFTPTTFSGCLSLKSLGDEFNIEQGIFFNKEMTEMYTWLGTQNNTLIDFVVPSTVERIGSGFRECKGLRSIDLSLTQITEIDDDTFRESQDLINVILPEGIKRIGQRAFFNCTNLKSLNLPNSIEELNFACFNGCALKQVKIPTKLKKIPESAFRDCTSLEEVFIPTNVTTIVRNAFENCSTVKYLQISIGFKEAIKRIFKDSNEIKIEYISTHTPIYHAPRTGAYTHGKLRPCPYCGSYDVQIYSDGTAECESCGGEYTYC